MTLNSGGSENDSACARMIWWATAWKVPPQIRSAAVAACGVARASMSSAARRGDGSGRGRRAPLLKIVQAFEDVDRFEHAHECSHTGRRGPGPPPKAL